MIHGWVIAWAGRRTSHQKRSMLNTIPVIHGMKPNPRVFAASAVGASGPDDSRCNQTRSGTSATNTRKKSPGAGKARLSRRPDAAARRGPRRRLMEPNLAASRCGLVDGVDDPHDLEPFLGGRLRALSLRDTPEKVLQLQLVGLLVQISRGVERRRDVLELP